MKFFFCKNDAEQYLQGIDANGCPVFTGNYDHAIWSRHENSVDLMISNNSLDVTKLSATDSGGVVPPHRPGF